MARVNIAYITTGIFVFAVFALYKLSLTSQPATVDRHRVPTPRKHTVKKILAFTPHFGDVTWGGVFANGHQPMIGGCGGDCWLSNNKTDLLQYDALVFHGRDKQLVPAKRTPNQAYIMMVMESPSYMNYDFPKGDKFYNWTVTYSLSSDVTLIHGNIFKRPQRDVDAHKKLPQMLKKREAGKAMIGWIVSHCGGYSERFKYLAELKKHIAIDVFGKCGKPCPDSMGGNSGDCFHNIAKSGQYKFYLSWENSMCEDYISLKPFRALNATLVPIVLGGTSMEQYKRILLPGSYIDVRNFTSPKALADFLKRLDGNDQEYLSYLAWRQDYEIHEGPKDFWCEICKKLHNKTATSTPKNVDWGQFWNVKTKCDNGFVQRILSKS